MIKVKSLDKITDEATKFFDKITYEECHSTNEHFIELIAGKFKAYLRRTKISGKEQNSYKGLRRINMLSIETTEQDNKPRGIMHLTKKDTIDWQTPRPYELRDYGPSKKDWHNPEFQRFLIEICKYFN